jgi:tetratricopeptide (TPR) repeat protein
MRFPIERLPLQALNRHQEAVANYNKAIAIKPDYVDALFNRGNALQALGRFDDALASYDKALAIRADFAAAFCNRGNVLQSLHRNEEAIASYDRALAIRPAYSRGAQQSRQRRTCAPTQ